MKLANPRRWLVMLAVAIAAMTVFAGPAAAHLDLVKTYPQDGATKTKPVPEVVFTFSVPGDPAGEGIVILDRNGTAIPSDLSTPDGGLTWVATPNEPLQDGKYGVKWRVAAPDTHPKTGAIRFQVALPAANGQAAPVPQTADDETSALDEVLAPPDTGLAKAVRWFGVTLAMAGAVFGIGGLVFLGFVMAGRRSEVSMIARRVRWSGAILIIGTLIQVVARSAMRQDGDWVAALHPIALGDILGGSFGWSIGLRLVGGVLIIVGVFAAYRTAPPAALATIHQEADDPIVKASLRRSGIAVLGAGLYLAAYLFDGHTITQTPLALVWATDVAHVLAAATWVGGIAMLATVLWRRKRANQPLDAAYLAVKFSVIAGACLVIAGIAGIGLTIEILNQPSQLWASTWGQILLAKVAVVAVVAAIGAYNHFRLIPKLAEAVDLRTNHPHLTAEPGPFAQQKATGPADDSGSVAVQIRSRAEATSDRISRELWFTAYAEVVLLIIVIGLTAWLVGSSAV